MCAVSMIGDNYRQQWQQMPTNIPNSIGGMSQIQIGPTRYEFDELKKEVLEMKRLLINAKEIDEKTGQQNCEQEEKIKILKAVAIAVGVDLSEVFGAK